MLEDKGLAIKQELTRLEELDQARAVLCRAPKHRASFSPRLLNGEHVSEKVGPQTEHLVEMSRRR